MPSSIDDPSEDERPPPSLESLRQAFAAVSSATSEALPPADAPPPSGSDLASSRLFGAGDGESAFTSLVSVDLFSGNGSSFFPGGVGVNTLLLQSLAESVGWSSVGVDPSLYSADSNATEMQSLHPYTPPTPLRSNRSVAGLVSTSLNPIQLLRDTTEGVGGAMEDDDYSLITDVTATTSRTAAGIRNVASAFKTTVFGSDPEDLDLGTPAPNSSLFASLMSPGLGGAPKQGEITSLKDGAPGVKQSSKPPALKQDSQLGSHAVVSSDPDACRAWLYLGPEAKEACLGAIGKQGLVCIRPRAECFIKSHSRKSQLTPDSWYVLTQFNSETAVKVTPSLPNSIAKDSKLWLDSKDSLHYAANWESLMSWVRENHMVASPSEMITTEAALPLLQQKALPAGTMPKTPKVLRDGLRGEEVKFTSRSEFVLGVKTSLENTDKALASIHDEMAKLSARIGVPPEGLVSQGSCQGNIATVRLYVGTIEESVAKMRQILTTHQTAFKQCEATLGTHESSINQAVASALAAYKVAQSASNSVQGFHSTGTVSKVNAHDQTIAGLQGEVTHLKSELQGVFQLVHSVIGSMTSPTAAPPTAAPAPKRCLVSRKKLVLFVITRRISSRF